MADLIEDFAVGDAAHTLGVGEARWGRIVHGGIGTIAFSCLAVTIGAFFEVDGAGGGEGCWRGLDWIFTEFCCFGNFPMSALINGNADGDANQGEEGGRKKFSKTERARRVGGDGQGEIFAYGVGRLKN